MFGVMLALVGLGIVLFLAAPLIGRLIVGREGDPVGITRVVQVIAVVLMVGALLIRPHSDETAAFPPPPDMVDSAR